MSTRDERTEPLGAAITGFVHAQINVSDLERSIEFYEMLGFEVISKGVIKDPQVFASLGLKEGRLVGAFLRIPGRSTKVTPMLDMIQFLDPPPTGLPYPSLNHLGINRLCFQVGDIEAANEGLVARGVELVGPVGEIVTKANGYAQQGPVLPGPPTARSSSTPRSTFETKSRTA